MSVQEIARLAGVSTATVSRVLNGSELVRPDTRARVEAVITELGYQTNFLARNLRTAESRLLLTMVPDFSNPFYSEIVRGIDVVARREGYHVLLCDTGAELPAERTYFDLLRNRLADGAICLDPDTTQHALAHELGDLCWVACCEFDPGGQVPYVGIDNERAAFDAVSYLIGRGRRRIALINSDERYLYARQRRKGYEAALAAAGLEPLPLPQTLGLAFEDGRACVAELLAAPVRPDAIFAVSDTLAIGAMRGVRDAGLSVPHDVAVVGFDNIPISTMVEPRLTTVEQPMSQLGETAASLLLKRLREPEAQVDGVILEHRLVVRDST
ncbi:MAG: LacI family DNA-binding transcriptional regulator [Polaromonas sp.]